MNITTHRDAYGWTAIDADTYDGAPDAGSCSALGHADTEAGAIEELLQAFEAGPDWQQRAAEAHRFFLYLQEAWKVVERRGIKGPIDTADSRAIRTYRQCGLTATEAGALRARELILLDASHPDNNTEWDRVTPTHLES